MRNLNVEDDVGMKGWPEEIPDRSVAGLSIDVSHIKCDVCKTGRSLGMINIIHPYNIGARKTHLGKTGPKEGILAREEQERQEALGDDITNDSKQKQLILARYFTLKGTGSRFSRPVSKRRSVGGKRRKQSAGSQWRSRKWQ